MALENTNNLTDLQIDLTDLLPAELLGEIDKLVLISKIAVYVIIAYIIFWIIKNIFALRRFNRIDKMYHKVNDIDRKLDLMLHHKNIKEKTEKKKGFFKKLLGKKEKNKINSRKEKRKKRKK